MPWEWSHANEAYANAYDNLQNQPHDWLAVCFAEWNATRKDGEFSNTLHDRAKAKALKMAPDTLSDILWEKASEQRTCDNGGFNAWVCPFGCHTVSFDCESED